MHGIFSDRAFGATDGHAGNQRNTEDAPECPARDDSAAVKVLEILNRHKGGGRTAISRSYFEPTRLHSQRKPYE